MNKLVGSLLLLVCLSCGILFWRNQQTEAQIAALQERLLAVQTDNATLKDAASRDALPKPSSDSEAAVKRDLEKAVERIHLLKFQRPIQYRTMASSQFKNFMAAKIDEVYSKEDLQNYSRALALLGLLPEGTDIGKVILKLYNEQVAAFYDQHKGELFTFSDFSLSENIDRMMLSHEMTHALQDQNYNLKNFPLEIKTNDDLALATAALVEGDATLLMTLWYMQTLTEGFDFTSILKDLGAMVGQNTEELAAAPAYFRESLLFPYMQGNEFVMALYTEGGYQSINKAFQKPPTSTEQILHPIKYLKGETPVEVALPEIQIAGWKTLLDNVLGQLGTRILLEQYVTKFEATRAAQGWGGDRYRVFDDGKGGLALLWISAWDTETDATEFHEAIDACLHKRVGLTSFKHPVGTGGFAEFGTDQLHVALRKSGSQVTVVLGPRQTMSRVVSAIAGAR